jgi:hypothetical protein
MEAELAVMPVHLQAYAYSCCFLQSEKEHLAMLMSQA